VYLEGLRQEFYDEDADVEVDDDDNWGTLGVNVRAVTS
jgi:hypothetical protein